MTVDLTFDLSDLTGVDFDARRTKVWIETNIDGDVIIDGTGNTIRLGDAKATVNTDGTGSFTGLTATNAATNPTAFQYRVFIDYPKASGQKRGQWCSGWFPLTATTDLADVAATQYVPPTFAPWSWQGAWSSSATYTPGALVSYGGSTWLARDTSANVTPTEGASWTLVASVGTPGQQGLPGPGAAAWTAAQAVTTGSVRQAPDGSWIKSTANRTTGSTFDATEQTFWTPVATSSGTMEQTGLLSTYAPHALARPGNRWVALGDSITKGSVDNTNKALGEAWPNYAALRSQGRLRLVRNSGVSGDTTASMLARFDTDVTAYSPNIVTIAGGTNDIGTSVSFATFKSNIDALVGKVRKIGAAPILATIPPRDAGGYGPTIVLWNAWLRDYAERRGITVIDFFRLLTDPTNGHYKAAYYSDGVHPSPAGAGAMGEVAEWVLSPLTPSNAPLLPVDSTDTNNLVGSPGLFLTAQGSGVGTSWVPGSAPTGVTKAVVTDSVTPGGIQRITMSSASQLWEQHIDISTGWAVGDTVRAVGIVSSDGGTGALLGVTVSFTGASASGKPLTGLTQALNKGAYCQDLVIPAGTTAIRYALQCGTASATAVVDFAQIGLYNLTQMGLSA